MEEKKDQQPCCGPGKDRGTKAPQRALAGALLKLGGPVIARQRSPIIALKADVVSRALHSHGCFPPRQAP